MATDRFSEKWECRLEKDESYYRELSSLFKELRSQAICNVQYFKEGKQVAYERFHSSFRRLCEHLHGIEPTAHQLIQKYHEYDVSPNTPANGYRSMVSVVHKCGLHLLQLMRYVTVNRDSFLFRSGHYSRELEAYVNTFGQLRACLYYLDKLTGYCDEGQLFPDDLTLSHDRYQKAEEMMLGVESLNQEPFYGRCLGFQYCDSMVRPLTTISLVMASYGEGYGENSMLMKVATSVLGGGKYLLNAELRAEQIVNVTRNSDIQFCKDFWSVAEYSLLHQLPLFICPAVQLDRVIALPAESFCLPSHARGGGDDVPISPPCAHTGHAPVNTRLISYLLRRGQEAWLTPGSRISELSEASRGLVIHCHGGGFVAQSSASHEVYLRHWAKDLGVPILAVDYSLAPENPFPRALEDVFFAYCWAIKNAHLLGWTGQTVVLVGDSAGANLVVAAALRAAHFGVRIPDGVVSIYGCMLVKYIPSPSRILALMDPLLPLGVLSKCLAAYAAVSADDPSVAAFVSGDPGRPSSPVPSPSAGQSPSSSLSAQFTQKASVSHDSGFLETLECADEPPKGMPAGPVAPPTAGETDGTSPVNTADKSRLHLDIAGSRRRRRGAQCPPLARSPSSPSFLAASPSSGSLAAAHTAAGSEVHDFAHIRHFAQSPFTQFSHMPIASNPYMSPYLASDEMLENLCPISFVACHLDPMLDDSVMFARRLRALGRRARLDVLPHLPHGFLNFVLVSHDAKRGSDVCVQRLLALLAPEVRPNDIFSIDDDDDDDDHWQVIN